MKLFAAIAPTLPFAALGLGALIGLVLNTNARRRDRRDWLEDQERLEEDWAEAHPGAPMPPRNRLVD